MAPNGCGDTGRAAGFGSPRDTGYSERRPDSKNSAMTIADLDQGGTGLPDRDYYLKTGEKDVALRNQYVAHVQKMFELIGVEPAEAARKAQAVLALETKLAQGALDRVSRRDPSPGEPSPSVPSAD